MASTKAYLDYVLEQLSALETVTVRPMMGEYILYCRGKGVRGDEGERGGKLHLHGPGAQKGLVPDGLHTLGDRQAIDEPGVHEGLVGNVRGARRQHKIRRGGGAAEKTENGN